MAEQAGVAIQTVYFHFGNKRTLLKEALDVAAVGDDEPVSPLERPWLTQLQQEPDPRRIIELWLANGRTILQRVAPLMRVVGGATGTDPELAAQWHTNQQQTRTAYTVLAELLADRGAFNPAITVDQARDIAFVITNVESYLQFSDVCGWTLDQRQERTTTVPTAAFLSKGFPVVLAEKSTDMAGLGNCAQLIGGSPACRYLPSTLWQRTFLRVRERAHRRAKRRRANPRAGPTPGLLLLPWGRQRGRSETPARRRGVWEAGRYGAATWACRRGCPPTPRTAAGAYGSRRGRGGDLAPVSHGGPVYRGPEVGGGLFPGVRRRHRPVGSRGAPGPD